jgi:L-seryl-tRNA(Ser) seleniumtransferase
MADLRQLPSVDALLHTQDAAELIAEYGRPMTLEAIRFILHEIRQANSGQSPKIPDGKDILDRVRLTLDEWTEPSLQPVINATGVILHTNLGRAPLSAAALQAMQAVAQGYSTLEFDMQRGKRGSRYIHAESLLKRLTGAEAALVVNNNASAVLLALTALAKKRRVLIARSQLIEIGGGFRIPDVMAQSSAILEEVGTTNRVHLKDYKKALESQPVKLVMRAHRSNFRISGFTKEPLLEEIVQLAHQYKLPVYDDLGSGTLIDTARFGLNHEPTIQESLAAGVDLVSFSGDKLLGGPQAGILVGCADLVDKLKKHPMARAMRTDKTTLAALSATLLLYLKDEAENRIPIWQMISMDADLIQERAQQWSERLTIGAVIKGESTVGGGSLPGESLPTSLLALDIPHPDSFLARLRQQHPPIIARVQEDRVVFDPRTVLPSQEGALLVGLQNVLK